MSTLPQDKQIEINPILRNYCIKETGLTCYDISGFFSPISIRDQIIRACSVIDNAVSLELISKDRPLLIIGGSAAGVTAAIKPASKKIRTVLIERESILKRLLESGRYFCPVQYDWVASHWQAGEFPWDASDSIPFVLREGAVQRRVRTLQRKIDLLEKTSEPLFIHPNIELKKIIPPNDATPLAEVSAEFKGFDASIASHLPKIKKFGMVLSCTGFGGERVFVEKDKFYSYEYWKVYEHFRYVKKGKLLICGSGDGALQDFLLFSCKPTSKKNVYNTAKEIYIDLNLNERQKIELERAVLIAEQKIKREEIWWNKADTNYQKIVCTAQKERHQIYVNEVEKLLTDREINSRLNEMVRNEAKDGKIKLAYKCNHFTAYYGLNYFLALLVVKYLEKTKFLLEDTTVRMIESTDTAAHNCDGKAEECAAYKHKVMFVQNATCTSDPPLTAGGMKKSSTLFL